MDWRALASYRWQIGLAAGLVVALLWYSSGYRPRSDEAGTLDERAAALAKERDTLLAAVAAERAQAAPAPAGGPTRFAPKAAGELTGVERLKFFLENVTGPANDLDLAYFTVTPRPPTGGAGYEEIPFSLAVAGEYPKLADFLYQLEYQRDFVVRDLSIARTGDGQIRADFQLAALLRTGPVPATAPAEDPDPGPPTSLELSRDPFTRAPAVLVVGDDGKSYFLNVPPGLTLSGVLRTGGRAAAIINHEPYRVGDVIDHKTVTRITRDGVELSDKQRKYFLEMEKPAVTRPARSKEGSR